MNPLGVGRGGAPGDQKLAFVPMDPENLPVSTVCMCVRVHVADLQGGGCATGHVESCVHVRVHVCMLGGIHVHGCTCRSAGAESWVSDCVHVQEWAWGSVCGGR